MRARPSHCAAVLSISIAVLIAPAPARADVADARLDPPVDLNGYFPFHPPATPEAWARRAEELRRRVLVSTGLWPMPERTPLEPVIHGRVERDGFTVEKVYFESLPGHYVTGLLFRPEGGPGKRPAVLCPHGHGGRLQDHGAERIRRLIVEGRERFEGSGRFPKLARCAQLARMGCVAFIFDMLGYADSVQISYQLAHRHAKTRPDFEGRASWGFYSTQAELRLQSILGLQTWNALRSLDFLAGLPDVDATRIGVTGGSGGGTQTILLGAIDERPVASFPQGMVSTSMQGGCTCENASLLRIGTGNVELAGLFAPRPLGMTAADDWTREMMTKGYPQLRELYAMLGVPDRVLCKSLLHFPHNYNYVTRAIMYSWFNRHLGLGLDEPIVEEDWRPLTRAESAVWNDAHPAPPGGAEHERAVTAWLDADSRRQIAALLADGGSLERYREVVGGAFETIIGRRVPHADSLAFEQVGVERHDGHTKATGVVRLQPHRESIPFTLLRPLGEGSGDVVVWVDARGRGTLLDDDAPARAAVERLVAAGASVLTGDVFLARERANRTVSNPREFAGYTYGYNDALFARRVHDVLALIAMARGSDASRRVHVVGTGGAGPWVATASALGGDVVDRTAVDTGGFRFVEVDSWRDAGFLPGAVKYGDLPGLLSLCAPRPLWIAGEDGAVPDVVARTYRASHASRRVTSVDVDPSSAPDRLVDWLLAGSLPRTSLDNPAARWEAVPEGRVEVRRGALSAVLVDNREHPPHHRAGYNGLAEIRIDGGPSPFVPAYAGLNLEHVNNGRIYSDRNLQFEPRRHPMELRRIDAHTYELYQAPLPETGLESCTRFSFSESNVVDVVLECIPRRDNFPHDHLNLFWASYILEPEDPAICFIGREKGSTDERWIRAVTPRHGELSTHRGAHDRRRFDHEEPFPLTLVFNESVYEYTRPFYYGRFKDNVWIVMFRESDHVRLTQSPSGGGRNNPAWDFQWFIADPRVGERYRLVWRAVYKPWNGREDVLTEYERFRRDVE